MIDEVIKPCPLCGGRSKTIEEPGGSDIRCYRCYRCYRCWIDCFKADCGIGAHYWGKSKDEARENALTYWNKRIDDTLFIAAKVFIEKLQRIHESPEFQLVWTLAQIHNGLY